MWTVAVCCGLNVRDRSDYIHNKDKIEKKRRISLTVSARVRDAGVTVK